VKRAPATCAEPGCLGVPVYRGRCLAHARWNPNPDRQRGRRLTERRARLMRRRGARCQRCSAPPPLELHHRDGDPANDRLDNLELLCPDCHLVANLTLSAP
jgi:5-methylcytosine-specific restriction endonuclease McrA